MVISFAYDVFNPLLISVLCTPLLLFIFRVHVVMGATSASLDLLSPSLSSTHPPARPPVLARPPPG